ncbi:MAG TPA: hypothetical protein VJN22_02950 [Candidatus Eremiobacteraceae bacterium]|nr:hypothetical protein [Candidatus Eremiobacteraceae bacterium]
MTERARAAIVIGSIVAVIALGYFFFLRPWLPQFEAVRNVQNENSTWTVTLQCYYTAGAVASETYRISNDNGKTSLLYSATDRSGLVTKQFDVPLAGPEGTFLFEQLRADGIWDLDDKPARPNAKELDVIEVGQTLGDEGGSRAFTFTDPKYWATTKSLEYKVAMPAASSSAAPIDIGAGVARRDDRYLKLVLEIKAFGPPSVLVAESRIRIDFVKNEAARVRQGRG